MAKKTAADPEIEALKRDLSEISRERRDPDTMPEPDIAELTTELDRLKTLLGEAEGDSPAPEMDLSGEGTDASGTTVSGLLSAALGKLPDFDQIMAELDEIDIKTHLRDAADEIERMTLRNPLLAVTGSLVLGILIGRATKGRH